MTDTKDARIAELEDALKAVRFDIASEASNVIFRPDGSTTFDYIGWVVGDPVSWDEWEARQAAAGVS